MSTDPFELGRIDRLGASQAASAPATPAGPGPVPGQASARAGGAAFGAPVPEGQDHVLFSDELEGSEHAPGATALDFASWSSQAQKSGDLKPAGRVPGVQAPGMQPGAVYGPDGISGLEPGMQAGGVHQASVPDRL